MSRPTWRTSFTGVNVDGHSGKLPDTYREVAKFDVDFEFNKVISLVVRTVQSEVFPAMYARVHSNQLLPEGEPLLPLDPFIDHEGIMRVGTQLQRVPIPYEERHPILLSLKHPITKKIWSHYHVLAKHQGRYVTNAVLRR